MSDAGAGFVRRLDGVRGRLSALAAVEFPAGALTAPDPPTGERWEAGQVWAHLAEFIPYWITEATLVIAGGGPAPVPFGRTKADPGRLAAIERDRGTDRRRLWDRVDRDIAGLRSFLEGVPASAWSARGVHPTLGEMDVARLVDEFLVGHLEEHADQLSAIDS